MMELVTGGSGSGKSAYAESVICEKHRLSKETAGEAPLYYIADMIPYGQETEKKIQAHREMRSGKGFVTLEWYVDLPGKLSAPESPLLKGSCVLLECISNLTANEMYESNGAKNTGKDVEECIIKGVRMLKERCAHFVVVTNDVFRESEPDTKEMSVYKARLSAVNRALAEMADRVTEVVSGIPVAIKTDSGAEDLSERKGRRGMKFVTGGANQGKLEYAKKLYPQADWTDGAECSLREILFCGAVDNFQLFVRRWMRDGKSPQELTETILNNKRDLIIVCDEIGCGLVPTDAFERRYRESVGRICTELAINADEVYRVVCGIGVRIK